MKVLVTIIITILQTEESIFGILSMSLQLFISNDFIYIVMKFISLLAYDALTDKRNKRYDLLCILVHYLSYLPSEYIHFQWSNDTI